MIKSYQDIQGWFDFENVYSHFVEKMPNNAQMLEIGTWLGKSTCYLGLEARKANKNIHIYGVDTFKGEDSCDFHLDVVAKSGGSIKHVFDQNVEDLGLRDIITTVESESTDCLDKIPVKEFDFIFIDADHKYEPIKRDIEYFFPHVKSGGIMAGHDFEHHVERAVTEFFSSRRIPVYRAGMCWIIEKP